MSRCTFGTDPGDSDGGRTTKSAGIAPTMASAETSLPMLHRKSRQVASSDGDSMPHPQVVNVPVGGSMMSSKATQGAVLSGETSARFRVLIVDDEPEIVEELGEYLGTQGFDWVGALDARSARERFSADQDIALVVTDLAMPGESGLALVDSLERLFGEQRVFASIVVTAHHNEETMLGSLQRGVRDFIGKPVDPDRLLESVSGLADWVERRRTATRSMGRLGSQLKAVEARISQLSDELRAIRGTGEAPRVGDHGDDSELPADWREKLTNRQQEVVRYVARGMSNYQIGYEMGISENTVKLYVSQILKTTRCRNRTQLALVAHGGQED